MVDRVQYSCMLVPFLATWSILMDKIKPWSKNEIQHTAANGYYICVREKSIPEQESNLAMKRWPATIGWVHKRAMDGCD